MRRSLVALLVAAMLAALVPSAALAALQPTVNFTTAWSSNYAHLLATDSSGGVYVPDLYGYYIRMYDAAGTSLTSWGGLGTAAGKLSLPSAVATYESSGTVYVYVAEAGNHRVQKFSVDKSTTPPTVNSVAMWGSSGTGDGQFNGPYGIATDASGNVYVADSGNNRIQMFDSSGAFLTKWGSTGSSNGQFDFPGGLAADSSGNVYVADFMNNRIQKFGVNTSTSPPTVNFILALGNAYGMGTGDGEFFHPRGVAVDGSGNIYVADTDNSRVQLLNASGTFLTKWGTYGTATGEFRSPSGVATDPSGNVYVADYSNNRVQKFSVTWAEGNTAPAVTQQPTTPQVVTYGQNATFTATASGTPSPSVQWQVSTDQGSSWTDISAATGTTLTLTTPPVASSGNQYHAVFTNTAGSATSTAATLTVNKADQTIVFGPLADKTDADPDFTVSATGGGSGNPVTFAASGTCTVDGSTVHIVGVGTCTITASQAGDANYNAATPVEQSFSITSADTQAPTVVEVLTPATASGNVTVTFSEPVQNVTRGTFKLERVIINRKGAEQFKSVSGKITLSGVQAELNPGKNLPNGSYVVTLTRGITDLAGNPLVPPEPKPFSLP